MGPLWVVSPARTWWEYCHTLSATIIGFSGSKFLKTSIPIFWESMNPWPLWASNSWALVTCQPCLAKAATKAVSISSCACQQFLLADSLRSPLATRYTFLSWVMLILIGACIIAAVRSWISRCSLLFSLRSFLYFLSSKKNREQLSLKVLGREKYPVIQRAPYSS